jgi:predicted GNAT family acetyltransferase
MSSTPVVPTTTTPTPPPDQQAPTTSSINLSDIPNHVEHAWEDVKNLFETGDTTGHPEETNRAAHQEMQNQATEHQGEADYKNFLYKSSPDEFKQAYPAEYLYRKAYNTVHQAMTDPAEHTLHGKAQQEIGGKIDELATAGLGAVGANKPGEAEPVIDTGNIIGPEGEMEENVEHEFHGDRINLAKTPNPKPTPKAPEAPAQRVDLSDIPGVKTVQHPVEITKHGPEWDRTHRMNVNGERAGSIGYHVEPNGTARIYGSHVPEHMRGQGIGQEGYKSVIDEARQSPNIQKITSDPTNVSPDAARVWQKLKEKGENVEEITHANGKPGFQIDFQKEPPGNPQVAESAQRYNATKGQPSIDHGKTPLPPKSERATLADAYDSAQHNPNDPAVQKAYGAMKTETKDQFNHAKNDLGISVDFTKEDPYKNAQEMQADLKNNHHLSVFTGGEVPKDHPMAEVDPETGQSFNNIFRATHDIFGHAAGGHDFSEAGEHSAFGAHAQMYSKDALPAVRNETQGQSNWFFNNKEVRNGKAPGDFPEQKAAILPEGQPAAGKRPIKAGAVVDPKIQKVVEDAGGAYRGQNKDGIVEITLPESMTKDLPIRDSMKKDVSVNLHADEVNPEAVKAAMERKVVEYGGAPKTDEVPPTGYHPDLQKVADKYGVSDDASGVRGSGHQASFIAPDGKFIHLPAGTEHPTAIEGATGSRAAEDIPALGEKVTRSNGPEDSRVRFIQDTGVVRTRFSNDRAGETLHVSVPEAGVTPEQMQGIKDAVRTSMSKGRGNIVMEVGVPGGKSETAEFATANNVEPMLNKIGAHPNDWTRKAESAMKESPAGAIDPRTGQSDTKGFGVEVFPEARSKREPLDHPPTRDDIRKFHDDNKEIFDHHPELRVGWDKTDKGWELNVGASHTNQAGAEAVGRKLKQRAVWDIANKKEIPTGGTGEQTRFPKYPLEERLNDLTGRTESVRNIRARMHAEKKLASKALAKD